MKKIILSSVVILIIAAGATGFYFYSHHCKNELREVDRYAQPYIIEIMQVLSTWDYEKLEPYLDSEYKNSLSLEDWNVVLEELKPLGELLSFARPSFVSHSPYKKFLVCESAIEFYSIPSEYEHANAVVRFLLDNNCGKLKIKNIAVTSEYLRINTNQQQDKPDPEETSDELETLLNDDVTYSDEELEVDLDKEEQLNEENLPEVQQSQDAKAKKIIKAKPKSKSYSW